MQARLGDPEAAISAYREALRLRPADPQTWYNLGNILLHRREAEEAVFYFTRYCLKGHQRKVGRRQTMAPGGLSPQVYETYLRNSDPTAKMLGDAEDWDDIDQMGSIFVGGPETIYQRLWEFIDEANIGNLLIQFHIGNLSYDLTQKSQRIFAEEVLPRLRADSEALFARKYPRAETPVVV